MPLRPNMGPAEYLDVFRRRKGMVIASFLLVMAGGAVYCLLAPRQYKSSTTILVIPQRVPENYVQSTVSSRIQDRLATIQQQVLSRTMLVAVMDELGLFKENRKKLSTEVLVEEMRRRVEVNIIGGKDKNNTEAFTISFVHESPQTAMLTASRMASFFIDENLKSREQQAVGTSQFLESQLQEAKARLEEQEEKVKQYKLANMGELPQQAQANLNTLIRLQEQAKSNADSLRAARDRKVFLEAQIGFLERSLQPGAVADLPASGSSYAASSDPALPLRMELEAKRARLADLMTRYTAKYPEVVQVSQDVSRLEQRLADYENQAATDPAGARRSLASRPSILPSSSGFQAMGRTAEELSRLKAQAVATGSEIDALGKEGGDIRRKIAEIQARVDRSPKREQELISLTRDYENLQKKYDDLLAKKLEADISQNLEKRQKGEQFQVIDPANLPEDPIKPDIPMVLGLALVIASASGFGGALGLEALNPILRDRQEFKHFFKFPILAAIPLFERDVPKKRFPFLAGRRRPAGDHKDCVSHVKKEAGGPRLELFMPLRARLESHLNAPGCQVVAVASAVASEGKSVTCAHLAMGLASVGWKRVLLVNADLYKPGIAKGADSGNPPGLADHLSGEATPEEIIGNSIHPGLHVVPAGRPVDEPARLLGGETFRVFLKEVRKSFDIILVDTPPVLSLADAPTLKNEVDGFIMVYRMGYTPYTLLRQAVEEVGEKSIIGVVLNGTEPLSSRYYKRYYENHYGRYIKAAKGPS